MRRIILCLTCGLVLWIALARGADPILFPAHQDAARLPGVLAQAGGTPVTAAMFRQKLALAARQNGSAFLFGQPFLTYVTLKMESDRLGLSYPEPGEIGPYLVELGETESLTPAQKLQASLLCQTDRIARARKMLAPGAFGTGQKRAEVSEILAKEYKPEFFRLGIPVVARVGGRNIGEEEVLDYGIAFAPDPLLRGILDLVVDETLLRQEATRQKIPNPSAEAEALAAQLLEKYLTESALKAWYLSRREQFVILRAARIFVADPKQTPESREAARRKALGILDALVATPATFEQTARTQSDCPSASHGGMLGYVCHPSSRVYLLPPRVFQLDRTEMKPADSTAFFDALMKLQDGELGGVVEVPGGFAVPKRLNARFPQGAPESILPLLRAWRMQEEGDALMKRLRDKQIRIDWTPPRR